MPTYDFRCPNGHLFEQRFARISEAPNVFACPTCGAIAERQISGGAGLVFKGSGFYITDYGKDGKKDQRTAGTKSTNESSKAGESKPADSSSGESKSGESSSGESKSSESKSSESAARPVESKPAEGKPAPAAAPKPSSGE